MASTSPSSAAVSASSSTQHIDIDIEEEARAAAANSERMDESMSGDITPGGEGAGTPQSVDSELATSFFQNNTSSNSTKKRQTGSKLAAGAETEAIVVGDNDDDDDLMETELPSREERVSSCKVDAQPHCMKSILDVLVRFEGTYILIHFLSLHSCASFHTTSSWTRRFGHDIFKVSAFQQMKASDTMMLDMTLTRCTSAMLRCSHLDAFRNRRHLLTDFRFGQWDLV